MLGLGLRGQQRVVRPSILGSGVLRHGFVWRGVGRDEGGAGLAMRTMSRKGRALRERRFVRLRLHARSGGMGDRIKTERNRNTWMSIA